MSSLRCDSVFERVMAALPAWMLLLCGAAMVAMVVLMPAWVASRKLDWQLQFMRAQGLQLQAQQAAYEEFQAALRQGDPVLLERMAFYHLRLKPAGVALIDQTAWLEAAAVMHQDTASQSRPWQGLPTIEHLLAPPMPDAHRFNAAQAVPNTRLVRIATGPARHWLLAFGVLCLFLGLLPTSSSPDAAEAGAGQADERDASPALDEDAADLAQDDFTAMDESVASIAPAELALSAVCLSASQAVVADPPIADEADQSDADDDELVIAEVDDEPDDGDDACAEDAAILVGQADEADEADESAECADVDAEPTGDEPVIDSPETKA